MNPADQAIFLIIFFSLTFFVFFIAWRTANKSKKEVARQYFLLGEDLDLKMDSPPASIFGMFQGNPSLYGKHEGHDVSIFSKSYGLDNLRQTDTCIRILTHAPRGMHFIISKRNLSGKLGQLGRHREYRTGFDDFDRQFILRSKQASNTLTRFFDEAVCGHIMEELSSETGFFTLEEGVLCYIEFGLIDNDAKREHIANMLQCMLELVEAFEIFRG